ncbi:hypothetical protein AAFF39_00490 [Lactococcus garvieae]
MTVGEWTSKQDFRREDVMYLKYKNQSLNSYTNDLFVEYGNVLGTLIANQKVANQVRATFEMPNMNAIEDEEVAKNGRNLRKSL